MNAALRFVVCLALCIAAACGKAPDRVRVHPVRGEVHADGEPAVNAFVLFHPIEVEDDRAVVLRPRGRVGADGSFKLTTYVEGDGAPAGNYSITIEWPAGENSDDPEMAYSGDDRLRGAYSDPSISQFSATVESGNNILPVIEISLRRER